MIKYLKYIILFVLVLINTKGRAVPTDTDTSIVVRTLSHDQVKEILSNDDYIFGRRELLDRREEYEITMSWWERFIQWLRKLFTPPKINPKIPNLHVPLTNIQVAMTVLKWILIFSFVGLLIWWMYRTWNQTPKKLRSKKGNPDFISYEEEFEKLDFHKLIEEAVMRGDYRKAVRLNFLYSLKLLTNQSLIEWQKDKTNYDYYYELSGHKIQKLFMRVTGIFEHIWYGDFPINNNDYRTIAQQFVSFYDNIIKNDD